MASYVDAEKYACSPVYCIHESNLGPIADPLKDAQLGGIEICNTVSALSQRKYGALTLTIRTTIGLGLIDAISVTTYKTWLMDVRVKISCMPWWRIQPATSSGHQGLATRAS